MRIDITGLWTTDIILIIMYLIIKCSFHLNDLNNRKWIVPILAKFLTMLSEG
jgi:hypothetical protein